MALWWKSVAIILSFFLNYVLSASQTRLTDADLYRYTSSHDQYDGEDLDFRPLLRTRRDDSAQNADLPDLKVKPGKPMKKATDDTTGKKKVPLLQKDGLGKTTTSAPTTTTTISTTTTTIAAENVSPSASSSLVPATNITDTNTTTTTIPTIVPDSEDSAEENRTGGMSNTTESEDTSPASPDDPNDQSEDGNDPDSGDDVVSPISGFITNNTTVDHHRYYRSHTITGAEEVQQYWVDFDTIGEEKYVHNAMLSASHRRAATVTLTFEFPFYGHRLRNITIATGGFLFTGNFVHTWLAATQYIAPLMANFDTSMSEDASVRYADNGTSFTVQWNNVLLKDHADAGTFTFQVTLHKNGDIVFTYKHVPVIVTSIGDDQHPVKVGLSDAYIVDRTIFFVRRKTIYEYHKIDMKKSATIGNWTAIFFKALPTCVSLDSCQDCLSHKISFQCQWCPRISRCSNGLDRHRQQWLQNGCETLHYQSPTECSQIPPSFSQPSSQPQDIDTFGRVASVQPYGEGSPPPPATNTTISSTVKPSSAPPTTLLPQPSSSPPQIFPASTQASFMSVTSSPNVPSSPEASTFINTSHPPLTLSSLSFSTSSSSSPSVVSAGQPGFQKWTTRRADASTYKEEGGSSVGGVVGVVFLVALILGIGGWVAYAYFFPHSPSGQMLIKYRPSTWSWKRGEARYTAAAIHSIHM